MQTHSVEQQLALLGWTGIPVTDRPPTQLAVTFEAASAVNHRLAEAGVLDQKVAVIHPAAAFATKQWAVANFARVAEFLADQGFAAVAIAAPKEGVSQAYFAASLAKLNTLYRSLLIPSGATILVGWLLLTCLFHEETESPRDKPGLRSYEVFVLWAFVALPVFEYVAAKLTGAPFFSRYAISAVAGFAGLFGVAVAKRPALAIATIFLVAAQIGLDFNTFASKSGLVEPSSSYQISTRIHEFNER